MVTLETLGTAAAAARLPTRRKVKTVLFMYFSLT